MQNGLILITATVLASENIRQIIMLYLDGYNGITIIIYTVKYSQHIFHIINAVTCSEHMSHSN